MLEKWNKLVLFLIWLYSKAGELASQQDKRDCMCRFVCLRRGQQS